ncbi:hypothetical protein GCM10028824_35170 [Hymenobacter segetis]
MPFAAHAQLGYDPANVVNTAGTYTDLAATGTAIATANTDDANSAAQPIGFTFTYNGTAFTQFVLNTNGFLKLGATAPSAADLFLPESGTATQEDPIYSADAADVNIIAPFNFDLTAGSAAGGTEYRVATTGTAPNRVCTIQWKNVADKTLEYDLQYGSMNFQVKLYETTGNIEFVYGTTTQGPNPDDYRFAVVGIKGSGIANGQTVLADRSSSAALWSTTPFITGYYDFTNNFYNYRGSVRPDVGRTYRFVPGTATAPTVANDDCATATVLTPGTTCTPTTGSVAGATQSLAPILCGGYTATAAQDVWYSFTATGSTHTIAITGAFDGVMEVFSGACGAPVSLACSDASGNNETLTLTTLTAGTTYLVRYYSYFASPASGAFSICVTAPAANDAAVSAIYTLGQLSPYVSPHAVQAVVKNVGTAAQTNVTVTLNVTGANTFTNTQTVASLAAGASATVVFAAYPSGTIGTNTVTVSVSVPNDAVTTNNSLAEPQVVSANGLSYVSPATTTFAGGIGSNSTTVTTAAFYAKYTASTANAAVTAVTPTFVGTATASNNYQVLVAAVSATGTPGTVLYTSPARVRPLAGGADVVTIPATAVTGDFFVGVRQLTTTNLGLAYQTESPLRLNTFYVFDGTTFADLGSLAGVTFRPALAATLSTITATTNAALAATVSLYPNPARQSFQLSVPTSLRTASATLSNALGQVVQSRQLSLPAAGGTADFNVSSLAPGIYTLALKSGTDLVVKRVVVE